MRAKTVNESIGFQRDLGPKRTIGIGIEAERTRIREFLDWIAEDEQLDPDNEMYMGFVNIAEDFIGDDYLRESFVLFIKEWHKNPQWIEGYMKSIHIDLENEPDIDEAIFIVA